MPRRVGVVLAAALAFAAGAGAAPTELPTLNVALTGATGMSVSGNMVSGAVSVVSGKIAGQTQTLTLIVEQRYENYDLAGAYAASALLAVIALATLLAMTVIKPRKEPA